MKLFLDTASLDEIQEGIRWGVLRGVTTNPTLVAKEAKDFLPLVKEICSVVDGDVSIETSGDDLDSLVKQGFEIREIADNAVVKIAMTPNGLGATRRQRAPANPPSPRSSRLVWASREWSRRMPSERSFEAR